MCVISSVMTHAEVHADGGFTFVRSPMRRGNTSDAYYHVFRNVKIQWVGENQLGVVFFSPPGSVPQREPIRGWTFNNGADNDLQIEVHYQQLAENDTASDRHDHVSDLPAS